MSTYEEIHGKRVEVFDSDPTLDSTYEGQVWFNSSTGVLKTVVATQAWSSSAPLTTARSDLGGFGVRDASVIYGGSTNATEEYNGTGFSAGGNLNTGRPNCQDNGWGVETAAVAASGYDGSNNTANVEEYNGSSFSEVNNVSSARRQHASIGLVQTAGAICGGYTSTNVNSTEEYDGTNWTSGGNLTTTRRGFAGSGTLTAGIVFSGYTTTVVANTEEYDGTSWTAATAINNARNNGIGASNAPQSTALLFGGNTGSDTGKTEQYNGTTWTEIADMATARDSLAGSGIGTAALAAGGAPPPGNVAIAEEFNQSINTITAGAFASTPNLNSSYNQRTGSGVTDACLCFGGEGPPGVQAINESFDGSSWSELNDLNTARSDLAGCGVQTASLGFGGSPGPTPVSIATEEWDGSSWTTSGNLNTHGRFCQGAGIQTAAYRVGGYISPPGPTGATNAVEHYDGSSWASQTAAPFSSYKHKALGTQTAGFVNRVSPPNFASYDYNGSSWTAGPNDLQSDSQASCFGSSTSSMYGSGAPTKCTVWNDTNFATSPNLGSGKGYSASFNAPSSASGMMYGQGNSSEVFTAETSTISAKTLTTS